MAKGKDAIQQVQTEIETLNQTEPQGTTSTGQTTNENYLYVQKKLINYKSIYNKKVYEKFI